MKVPARIRTLEELAEVVSGAGSDLYVRWTDDVERDMQTGTSRDELTGVPLPGLSANPLTVESWWGERPMTTWVARRLYDYRHLPRLRGPGTKPWIVAGRPCGRGPDNEPLLTSCAVIAEIDSTVAEQATELVDRLGHDGWGPLDRAG